MHSHPTISVIIPTLDEEKLIGRTLAQFTPEIKKKYGLEIIVSDGGSRDQTIAIARNIADRIVEVVEGSQQNIARGRNLGARDAKGDILIFINADTLIENIDHFLSEMTTSLSSRADVSAATCAVGIYRDEERFVDRVFHGIYNTYFNLLNRIGIGMGRGECHVVRRETFVRVGGYNEAIAAGEDFEFFVRLRRMGRVVFHRQLRVNESPRRYRRYGYLVISMLWLINGIWVLLFRKSLQREWKPVR